MKTECIVMPDIYISRTIKLFNYITPNVKKTSNAFIRHYTLLNIINWYVSVKYILKYTFVSISGTNNIYYPFTGPRKNIPLTNSIGGKHCLGLVLIIFNPFLLYEIDICC